MTLKEYLEENKVDLIEDDQEFMETEYNAVRDYCEGKSFSISEEAIKTIESRGMKWAYDKWMEGECHE